MSVQEIFGAVGAVAGSLYVVGSLVVNVHLSRFGIAEYQVLRAKYLAVGLAFLIHGALPIAIATIPLVQWDWLQVSSVAQMMLLTAVPGVALTALSHQYADPNKGRPALRYSAWLLLGAAASWPPLSAILQRIKHVEPWFTTEPSLSDLAIAIMACWSIMVQVYSYARMIYGLASPVFGYVDRFGTGVPATVRLVVDPTNVPMLKQVGIGSDSAPISQTVTVLDETDGAYVLGIKRDGELKAIRLRKDVVMAVEYDR